MRIAIFGTGGAGGYFGARIARAGGDVVFIARGEHLKAIRERGLRIESVDGDFEIRPAQAVGDPAEAGPADIVLLGVKSWQVSEAAKAMGPLIVPGTAVVPLQNGVEAPGLLSSILGPNHVLGGMAKVLCHIAAPGLLRHLGGPASISFGELDNGTSDRVERLRVLLVRSGLKAEVPPDIHAALWEKFLFIAPWGGVGAVTRAPLGILRSLPETRGMLEQGMREIFHVARERGVRLGEGVVERTMASLDAFPADGTTSMQRDILAGRPSELEAWNGAVVRLGRELGIETPLHDFLHRSLLPQELKARGRVPFP